MESYIRARQLMEALAAEDLANIDWQRNLSVSHNKIGDVLEAQGDGPTALDAYRRSLDIREAVAGVLPGRLSVLARSLGQP